MQSSPRSRFGEFLQDIQGVLTAMIQEIPIPGARILLYGILLILSLLSIPLRPDSSGKNGKVCPETCPWIGFDTTVVDSIGPLTMRFRILTDEYRWRFSETIVELAENSREEDLPDLLDGILNFERMDGIISVGTASHEGGDSTEALRADQRARALQAAVRGVARENASLQFLTLNLGRFQAAPLSHLTSSDERPIIVIGIEGRGLCERSNREIAVALQQALQKGASDRRFDHSRYAQFVLDGTRLECA